MRYLLAATIAIGLAVVTVGTAIHDASADVEIPGVDRAELESADIRLERPSGRQPRVLPEQAAAGDWQPGATVRDTVLVRVRDRDVWAIVYDPATVGQASGGPNFDGSIPEYTTEIAIDFVDAETGEYVEGIQIARPK